MGTFETIYEVLSRIRPILTREENEETLPDSSQAESIGVDFAGFPEDQQSITSEMFNSAVRRPIEDDSIILHPSKTRPDIVERVSESFRVPPYLSRSVARVSNANSDGIENRNPNITLNVDYLQDIEVLRDHIITYRPFSQFDPYIKDLKMEKEEEEEIEIKKSTIRKVRFRNGAGKDK